MLSSNSNVFTLTALDQKRFQPSGESHSNLRERAFTCDMETSQLPPHLNFSLEDLPGEIWLSVPKYDRYEASNKGRFRKKVNKVLISGMINKKGYVRVKLTYDTYKYHSWPLHRVIAITFIPNPDCKPQINHKDGNKQNNRVDNLEWCTQKENNKHAYETGLNNPTKNLPENTKGVNNAKAVLSEEDVYEIRKRFDEGETIVRIWRSSYYNIIGRDGIAGVCYRKTWKHLPEA